MPSLYVKFVPERQESDLKLFRVFSRWLLYRFKGRGLKRERRANLLNPLLGVRGTGERAKLDIWETNREIGRINSVPPS